MEKVKLHRHDITLGQPMPWNIYRPDGSILLKKGLRIISEKNLDFLMQSELLRDAENDPVCSPQTITPATNPQTEPQTTFKKPDNPFEWINCFAQQLKQVYANIGAEKIGAVAQIQKLSENILKLSTAYKNQFLCAAHMYYPQNYSLMQPIYSALLCDMTACILGYSAEHRASIRAAALTANLGMYSYQDTLNQQAGPLTEEQREELHLHPYQSAQILKAINVSDVIWLSAITGHHERNDGSGYPAKITTHTIKPESKILNLADSYLAMISNRSYNNTTPPKIALQQLYTSANEADQSIYLAFIKALGIFPPGTYVKLANKEIAIVTEQSATSTLHCKVSSICNENHKMFDAPVRRDTADKKYAIKKFFTPTENMNIDPVTLWRYKSS